jgi:hypothetical protein
MAAILALASVSLRRRAILWPHGKVQPDGAVAILFYQQSVIRLPFSFRSGKLAHFSESSKHFPHKITIKNRPQIIEPITSRTSYYFVVRQALKAHTNPPYPSML